MLPVADVRIRQSFIHRESANRGESRIEKRGFTVCPSLLKLVTHEQTWNLLPKLLFFKNHEFAYFRANVKST